MEPIDYTNLPLDMSAGISSAPPLSMPPPKIISSIANMAALGPALFPGAFTPGDIRAQNPANNLRKNTRTAGERVWRAYLLSQACCATSPRGPSGTSLVGQQSSTHMSRRWPSVRAAKELCQIQLLEAMALIEPAGMEALLCPQMLSSPTSSPTAYCHRFLRQKQQVVRPSCCARRLHRLPTSAWHQYQPLRQDWW